MSIIGSNILAGASGQGGGYTIENSLRFRSSASAYLNRTFTTPTDGKRWTWSGWVKRGVLTAGTGTAQMLFSAGTATAFFRFSATDTLISGWSGASNLETTQRFRDPSAWYHVMLVVDTTQATASNRVKYYVNGVQITAFATTDYPTQNSTTVINSAVVHNIGAYTSSTQYLDGYLTEVNFIDGQALDPSSFGEYNADTGVWQPVAYTGSYGTNGFYLPFSDNTNTTTLVADSSGNGNDWTPNNISLTSGATYDSMTDTPTIYADGGNYAVINPLDYVGSGTLSQGNLYYTGGGNGVFRSTIGIPDNSNKFYFEITQQTSVDPYNPIVYGLASLVGAPSHSPQRAALLYCDAGSGHQVSIYENGSYLTAINCNITSIAVGDIIQFAYDSTSGSVWVGKNNAWCDASGGSTGNPSTGANPTYTFTLANQPLTPTFDHAGVAYQASLNCGQQPFAYTPPTGFLPLHTGNLPDSAVVDGSQYFNATTYTGTGTTNAITGVGFQPDLVWIKKRATEWHALVNVLSGTGKFLRSDSTDSEITDRPNCLTSFDSDGFTVGNEAVTNQSGQSFVAWNWKANGAGVSNGSGSITSTVSANPTAGFSIVTYTGNGSPGATVGHGLGVAPSMVIVKNRTTGYSYGWNIYHASLGATKIIGFDPNGASTLSSAWNDTSPTSSVFSLGTIVSSNRSGNDYVSYCFADVEGYSKFGSYTGNGLPNGTFVYTGFRPAFVLVKNADVANSWRLWDNARPGYNLTNLYLSPDTFGGEGAINIDVDLISNGFKIRNTNSSINGSGNNIIYAAFAENPFKNSLAR